jgi:phage gp46-like protein
MADLALAYDPNIDAADLCIVDGDLALDDGLASLVLGSLLTDARADVREVELGEQDRRGWWGDALEERGVWGGKLWLLGRNKTTREVLRRAEDYAQGALSWMVTDGIVARFDISATRVDGEGSGSTLNLRIVAHRPTGEAVQYLYDLLWRAT